MNEFIEKLIGRLEEQREKYEHGGDDYYLDGKYDAVGKDIEIINELAEEHSHCTLCYLQGPCEYQNENVQMPMEYWESGWIPCSERLPECHLVRDIFKRPTKWQTNAVLVTVKSTECDGVHYYVGKDYMVGITKEDVDWLMSCGYGGSAVYEQEIIAWQPLPEPYKQKGGAE